MSTELLQLGAVAVIFIFAVKEFFAYLKVKKGGNGHYNKEILKELQDMNNNHLNELTKAVTEGNREIVKTIHDGNMRVVELLGEIKGGQK